MTVIMCSGSSHFFSPKAGQHSWRSDIQTCAWS